MGKAKFFYDEYVAICFETLQINKDQFPRHPAPATTNMILRIFIYVNKLLTYSTKLICWHVYFEWHTINNIFNDSRTVFLPIDLWVLHRHYNVSKQTDL